MIKVGMIFRPTDSRRDNRRIRVVRTYRGNYADINGWHHFAKVESRLVGERKWKPAPAIRLDRLESRHYKLLKDA